MTPIKFIALPFLVLIGAAQAQAQASGNVSGIVTARDTRASPYEGARLGVAAPPGGRITSVFDDALPVPLREVWVQLFVCRTASACTTWYTRTNGAGRYSIDWSESFTPVRLRMEVLPRRPWLTAQPATKTRPEVLFSVGGDRTILGSSNGPIPAPANAWVPIDFDQPSEIINAFLTTREVYAMWRAQGGGVVGGSLRAAMRGVNVTTVVWADFGDGGGVTLTDSLIQPTPRQATENPFGVAHELGHALVWRALGLPFALINLADYNCVFAGRPDANPGWADFSYECEKAAFHDALAHLNAALWMWRRDSINRIVPRGPNPWGLEGAGTCAEDLDEENRVVCNTRALWDVVDIPNDAIDNRDLSDVVSVLRSYPRLCPCGFDNGCANEGYYCYLNDLDGSNWKDFKRNYVSLFGQAGDMDAIEAGNGLTAQTDF